MIQVRAIGARAGLYSDLLKSWTMQMLPPSNATPQDRLETITNLIVQTGKVRYGPKPSPESLVEIRKVIRRGIETKKPIPVLVPWGSRKPNLCQSIDVADLMAINTLKQLASQVKSIHQPGLDLRIRVEDIGGKYLFADEGEKLILGSDKYVKDLLRLIFVVDPAYYITPVLESQMMTQTEHDKVADGIFPYLASYLSITDLLPEAQWMDTEAYRQLVDLGWRGSIPKVQREYYRGLYRNMGMSDWEATQALAKYFAGAYARYLLKAAGQNGEYLQINFSHPIPGAPEDMVSRRVHYRTIPENYTRNHIAPWRAKGFFRISEDDEVTPSLGSWSDTDLLSKLNSGFLDITSHAGTEVTIHADYLVG